MEKCADCGFLASRNVQTRWLEETEEEIRREGGLVVAWNTGKPLGRFEPPICFRQNTDYKPVAFTTFVDTKAVKAEINKERNCDLFTEWKQGHSPREHLDMINQQLWLEYQDRKEKEDKEWREKQEQRADRRHKWDLIILGFVATAAIVAATIIAAFIQRGS